MLVSVEHRERLANYCVVRKILSHQAKQSTNIGTHLHSSPSVPFASYVNFRKCSTTGAAFSRCARNALTLGGRRRAGKQQDWRRAISGARREERDSGKIQRTEQVTTLRNFQTRYPAPPPDAISESGSRLVN